MELIQINEKTYYLSNPTNIGIYKINEEKVILIDSGNDSDAGKKIQKIIEQQNWKIEGIINTHSHADHIGGNKIIQERTNCIIWASKLEKAFIEFPILEPALLYGANPKNDLKNKFLFAKTSKVTEIKENQIMNLEIIPLKGHSPNMIGIKTKENVYFLGDALFGENTIEKYHIFYLYDIKEFLNTLEYLKTLEGTFILSHNKMTTNLKSLIEKNQNKVLEIVSYIETFCKTEKTAEEIIQEIFLHYKLLQNQNQMALIGSTIRGYLTYLENEKRLTSSIINGKLVYKS